MTFGGMAKSLSTTDLHVTSVLSFNEHLPNVIPKENDSYADTTTLAMYPNQIQGPYRHLFVKLHEKGNCLNERIETYCRGIGIDMEWSHPGIPNPESICTYGRLVSDAEEGKWNDKSVLLEASRELGSGTRVKLHLENVSSYSLFPGQVKTMSLCLRYKWSYIF